MIPKWDSNQRRGISPGKEAFANRALFEKKPTKEWKGTKERNQLVYNYKLYPQRKAEVEIGSKEGVQNSNDLLAPSISRSHFWKRAWFWPVVWPLYTIRDFATWGTCQSCLSFLFSLLANSQLMRPKPIFNEEGIDWQLPRVAKSLIVC